MRQVTSSRMRGIPEASNMVPLLLLVSVFGKNSGSRLRSGRRLRSGETRRSLSGAHDSLLQHKTKTHQSHSPTSSSFRGLSEKLQLPVRNKKKHSLDQSTQLRARSNLKHHQHTWRASHPFLCSQIIITQRDPLRS